MLFWLGTVSLSAGLGFPQCVLLQYRSQTGVQYMNTRQGLVLVLYDFPSYKIWGNTSVWHSQSYTISEQKAKRPGGAYLSDDCAAAVVRLSHRNRVRAPLQQQYKTREGNVQRVGLVPVETLRKNMRMGGSWCGFRLIFIVSGERFTSAFETSRQRITGKNRATCATCALLQPRRAV